MALTATMYHFEVTLSDVERGVYTELDLRVARHPSESFRYLMLRTLAYCLCYEEGIAFSKGGISSTDESPVSIRDATGALTAWIDVGSPTAERLHKASKAAPRVVLFSAADRSLLRKEAASRSVHRLEDVELYYVDPAFLDGLESSIGRNTPFELVRSEGRIYLTVSGKMSETALERESLLES
jgi:uncharacterized protein YaeQ